MAFTRTPCAPTSLASDRVKARIAPFAAVMSAVSGALDAELRRNIDDAAALLRQHAGEDGTVAEEHTAQIRRYRLVPDSGRHLKDWDFGEDASIVHPDIDSSRFIEHRGHQPIDLGLVADISACGPCPALECLDFADKITRRRFRLAIADPDVRAGPRQGQSYGFAELGLPPWRRLTHAHRVERHRESSGRIPWLIEGSGKLRCDEPPGTLLGPVVDDVDRGIDPEHRQYAVTGILEKMRGARMVTQSSATSRCSLLTVIRPVPERMT